ncbi:MAG: hypothetical protein WC705_00745 [Candidatus Paceibacterota bacterium]|jgi:hypothetical protein
MNRVVCVTEFGVGVTPRMYTLGAAMERIKRMVPVMGTHRIEVRIDPVDTEPDGHLAIVVPVPNKIKGNHRIDNLFAGIPEAVSQGRSVMIRPEPRRNTHGQLW